MGFEGWKMVKDWIAILDLCSHESQPSGYSAPYMSCSVAIWMMYWLPPSVALMPSKLATEEIWYSFEMLAGIFLGEIWMHMQRGGRLFSIVSCYRRIAQDRSTRSAQWQTTDAQAVVDSTDIIATATWLRLPDATLRTLVPTELF